MKLEKIIGPLSALIASSALFFASPDYADAKVTQVERRFNGTITQIFDDEYPESYLYPVRSCSNCNGIHRDNHRRKVELLFQAENGKLIDYPVLVPDNSYIVPDNPVIIITPPFIPNNNHNRYTPAPPIFPNNFNRHPPQSSHNNYNNHNNNNNSRAPPIHNKQPEFRREITIPKSPSNTSNRSQSQYSKQGFLPNNSYIPSKNLNKPQQQNKVSPPQRQGFVPSNKYIPSKHK